MAVGTGPSSLGAVLLILGLTLGTACGDDLANFPGSVGDGDGSGDGDGDGDGDTTGDGDSAGDGDTTGDGDSTGDGDGDIAGDGDSTGDGDGDVMGEGECCADGDCLCHGTPPKSLTSSKGPYATKSYTIAAGCIHYPTDAEPPFAAVAVSDGYLGSGGCSGLAQTGDWGPLYASWGIVTMIISTNGGDQPSTRGTKLTAGIAAFKSENGKSGSPLYKKLAGRYGTSGFSMGGGGTSFASADDPSLLTSIPIMPYGPTREKVTVPTLIICGATDNIASCGVHGTPYYGRLDNSVPKMRVQVSGGHVGQPDAGGGASGKYGLAFQKVFLEGDERWRPLLVGADSEETTIK